MWRPKLVGRRGITTRVISGIDIALWDIKGKVSNFELEATTTFNIKHNQKEFSITLNELLNIENVDDSFKQKKYETIIKRNFAESMKDKLILKLNTL